MKKQDGSNYSNFIKGEIVNLCVPNKHAIERDGWADWFNDRKSLTSSLHGVFPNCQNSQFEFLKQLENDNSRIVLLICCKESKEATGVISLQNICFRSRSAEISILNTNTYPLGSLEAMALLTEHAFDYVGLQRIYAGQAFPELISWNKMLELIAYRTEGITRKSFQKGQEIKDTMIISCQLNNYNKIKLLRGSLWGSTDIIKKLLKKLPKESFAEKLDGFLKEESNTHFDYLD